ncbi:MAG: 50S ribosomal protein L16 [Candidatus Collierbacteria bacterium GW2011_GWC1_45_47]|uniref:50S ribosomal protein L16 n=2 Tax=Candidatus Collieribacteriota TaxID=1752725 RepID=A0A0G1HKX5_9BACT|nr:MAG: 50S ribosomal protein L16 [Candidatus Collierbacteria bacterium GW2011_GWF2_44_15]KKU09703.1 MAG: 50S ribosomal protein L16 [Candidatus Collierbacteria bacterium GW2011_GWC1_45_47]KKU30547.1 MAG: 50S ribosomal protein L16 [Candidatus Collierbacteria bacterium GW2011_GWE1_46_18]
MLQPARRKYRKEFRGTMSGIATRSNTLSYGDFGIKTQECGWLSAAEIESARRTITHHTKRVGKFFLRVFPHKPITNKVAGARMGSGKADISGYVAVVKPGQILMEISGVSREIASEAIRLASHKLSVKTKFIEKNND